MPHPPTRVTTSGQVLNEPALNPNFIHPRSQDGIKCAKLVVGEITVKEHGAGVKMDSESYQTKIQTQSPVKEREEEAS